jgi:DNA-binding CsgD family transcriptional regulator
MRILTFYELPRLARGFGAFIRHEDDVDFTIAASADDVERALSGGDFDGVIVPRVSIPAWWDIEPNLSVPVSVPRLVAVVRDPGWSPPYVDRLGFDGLLLVNTEASPRRLIDDIVRLVSQAPTRGARPPEDRRLLDAHPGLEEITDGDPLNLQILSLLAIGRGDKEIAVSVFLSHQTVRNRVSAMIQRSGMRNRTELVLHYLHHSSPKPTP